MKKIKLLFGTLVITFGVLFQIQAQAPFTNGLVAYYPFNGNANDASGNGNHATPAGNYQFLTNGLPGGAIRIVGDNSQFYAGGGHVMLPAFDTSLNSGFTCSLWVKDEVIGVEPVGAEFYVGFASGAADSSFNSRITLNNWSPAFVGFANGNGSGTGVDFRYTIDMATHPTSWKHLVMATTPGRFSCYLNGSKIYETNVSYGAVFPAPLSALGRHWWPTGSSARMSVTYDNVRIYNRALSDSEIQQVYAYEGFQLTNGLVAYYPFNGNANDESGNGNNGTVNAAALAVDRFGITNSAYAFDGVSSLITVPDSPSLRILGDITVACWVNLASTPSRGTRFVGKGIGCGRNYGLWLDKPGPDFYWMFQQFPPEGGCIGCQENTASSTPSVTLGKWYHVVGVRSGNVSRLYVDGILLGDADAHPENCSPTTYTGSEPLRMGEPGEPVASFMHGSLDDIRIYNRALSSNEVAQLYAIESPPILNLRKAVYVDSSNVRVGTNYQLQVSADLNTWTNHGAAFTATNSAWRSTNYWDVDNWSQLFFRLQVAP